MTDAPNTKLVKEAFDAFDRGDVGWIREHLSEDVTWHVAGHNRFSGDYRGADGVLDLFERTREATGGTLRFEAHDVVSDEHHAVALGSASARDRGGKGVTFNFAIVFHLVDGRASDVWGISDVGPSTDEFFDSLPAG